MKPSSQSLSIICQDDETEKNEVPKVETKKTKSFFPLKFREMTRILNKRGANTDNSLNNSVPYAYQVSVPTLKNCPVTSTPKNELDSWPTWMEGKCYDVSLWQHVICCFVVLIFSWLPTVSFLNNVSILFFLSVCLCHGSILPVPQVDLTKMKCLATAS